MKNIMLFLLTLISFSSIGQRDDEEAIKQIFDKALLNGKSYTWLQYLSTEVGSRLSGSPGAAAGVEWSRHELENIADSVWLQPIMVPHWIRGQKEIARIINSKKLGTLEVKVCALGNSIGTGPEGVIGGVVEVKSFDELKQLGEKNVRGKIVFFNRPMDPTKIRTFLAYVGAVDQRGYGASEAAKYGAIGVIVRSMGLNLEDYPHTGDAAGIHRILRRFLPLLSARKTQNC